MEVSGTIVPTRGEPSTLKKLNSSDLVNNGLLILHLAILQMIFERIQIEDKIISEIKVDTSFNYDT